MRQKRMITTSLGTRRVALPPLHPPQVEPAVGEYFLWDECRGGMSDWLLLGRHPAYVDVEDSSSYPPSFGLQPGDVLIAVTVRVRDDSDGDNWTWAGGGSYDSEGNHLTSSLYAHMPSSNLGYVEADDVECFTYAVESHDDIALIRAWLAWS